MSLSAPAPRRQLHTRRIVFEGFERDDGLYDIEASIVDHKHFDYDGRKRGHIAAGTPIHDMQVRLTVDSDRILRAIEVVTQVAPYGDCFTVAPKFQELVGKSVAKGWRRTVNDVLGGACGCTHLRELLTSTATVVFQTMEGGQRGAQREAAAVDSDAPKPFFINACRAWSEQGELVEELFPKYYIKLVQ